MLINLRQRHNNYNNIVLLKLPALDVLDNIRKKDLMQVARETLENVDLAFYS